MNVNHLETVEHNQRQDDDEEEEEELKRRQRNAQVQMIASSYDILGLFSSSDNLTILSFLFCNIPCRFLFVLFVIISLFGIYIFYIV